MEKIRKNFKSETQQKQGYELKRRDINLEGQNGKKSRPERNSKLRALHLPGGGSTIWTDASRLQNG